MRFMLIALIGFLMLAIALGFDPGPLPGLNVKNAMLYLIMLLLLLRVTLDRRYRIQMPSIPLVFLALLGYSILTYAVVVLVIHYPGYNWLPMGILLKNLLADQMLFFLVFFYGLRSDEEAVQVLKIVLACWAVTHVAAVLSALGFLQVGRIEPEAGGRVQGLVGEPNQYGAFCALSLAATASLIFVTRRFWRLFWIGATAVSALALIMTVSRGAFVGAAVSACVGLYLFRRYVPPRKLFAFAGWCVLAASFIVAIASALGFGKLLADRLLGGARVAGDVEGISSGRTQIWATAISVMWEQPMTLLTGYGWQMYANMPFRLATHNHYLASWFNLGLVGVTCAVLLFVLPIRYARKAALRANDDVRPLLIGYVIAALALAASVFFVDLYAPWNYFWAYTGVMMRIAINAIEGRDAAVAVPARGRATLRTQRDVHGWSRAPAQRPLR
jgi:O-Antigen ligase.